MIELPNLARLFLALFLLSLWLARPANKTPLYWAIAYLGLAAGSFSYLQGTHLRNDLLLQLAPLGPGLYVGLFWAGALSFKDGRVYWRSIGYLIAGTAAVVSLSLNISQALSAVVVGCLVAAVTSAAAWIIWRRKRQYRLVAVILFAQALLLAATYALVWEGPAARYSLAAGYSFLAIGLTYVILKESNETIERQATIDEVTGLPNRRLFLELLGAATRSLPGADFTTAALIIDVDNFKRVSYAMGQQAGDQVLKELGMRLKKAIPQDRTLARFGTDEFALLLPRVEQARANAVLEEESERVTGCLKEPFEIGGQSRNLSVSIGIATSLETVRSPGELLDHLKATASQLAQRGRATRSFFSSTMSARAQRTAAIEHGLWRYLESGDFSIHYQPIVSIGDRRTAKAEALLRWSDPVLGPVTPDEFIPIAEQSGLIVEIGSWVLDEACRQAKAWNGQRQARNAPPLVICVNVSAMQIRRSGFAAAVRATLAKHSLPCHLLELELTENVLIGDDENVHRTLGALRELGVSLSLDDFGTGFSSLSYLNRFEFNTLKIDKSFVTEIEANERSRRLAESICALGKSLGLTVVAEGVESEAGAQILQAHGVDYLQGFLFGKPMPAEDFRGLLPPG
jgi:diguanylate cyclase (GGDEF)-like protein